jgi:hypothetical protein
VAKAEKSGKIRTEKAWVEMHSEPEGVDTKYTTEEWVSVAQDEHGHSSRLDIRVSPHMAREMALIVAGKKFPFRTVQDLAVHAIYRDLYRLHKLEPTMPRHILSAMEANTELLRDDQIMVQIREHLDLMAKRASYHQDQGDHKDAIRLMNSCRAAISNVKDGVWKRKWMAEWKVTSQRILDNNKVIEMPSAASLPGLPRKPEPED